MYTWLFFHWHPISLEPCSAYITPWAPNHSWWKITHLEVRSLIQNHWCNTLGSMSNVCQLKKSTKRIWPSLHSNLRPLLSINDCCTIGFNNRLDMWWCYPIIYMALYLWIPPIYYHFKWAVLLLKALVALGCSWMEVGMLWPSFSLGLHLLWMIIQWYCIFGPRAILTFLFLFQPIFFAI